MNIWQPRKSGWITGRKTRTASGIKTPAEAYGVHYTPAQCPTCFSLYIECYSVREDIRYYKCRECGKNFKAIARYQFPIKLRVLPSSTDFLTKD